MNCPHGLDCPYMQDWRGPFPLGPKWCQQYPHAEMVVALAKAHDASQTLLPTPPLSKEAGLPTHQPTIPADACELEDHTTPTMSQLVGKPPCPRSPQELPHDQKYYPLTIVVMILCLSTCSAHNTPHTYVADSNWQPINKIPSFFPQHVTESHLSNLTAQLFPTPPRRPRSMTHAHTFDKPHTSMRRDWGWGWVGLEGGGQGVRRTSGHLLQLTPATPHLSTHTRRTLHWSKLTPPPPPKWGGQGKVTRGTRTRRPNSHQYTQSHHSSTTLTNKQENTHTNPANPRKHFLSFFSFNLL